MADCGSPPVSVFSKHLGGENVEEEEWVEEEQWVEEEEGLIEGEEVIEYSEEEEEVEEEDIEDDMRKEQEKTSSLISEVTKWEKMRQAGQKLSEGALTKDTIDSYRR
jgi:hypothetical protein